MPPLAFMFGPDIRDSLLFGDKDFTYSRRYFWAHQTLRLINGSMSSMIDAYERTFTDLVWDGKHKTLWPRLDQNSARDRYFKENNTTPLPAKSEIDRKNLRKLMQKNDERRERNLGLKEELVTGTSIQKSRKSVQNTKITIQQGHNIKLLSLVSIFFLPSTFFTFTRSRSCHPTAQGGCSRISERSIEKCWVRISLHAVEKSGDLIARWVLGG